MPAQWIHQPWAAPPQVLDEAEVKLGVTYPWPIVEHVEARKRALEALAAVTK
jgi:deoxyribodipyrimidine photo-lyase